MNNIASVPKNFKVNEVIQSDFMPIKGVFFLESGFVTASTIDYSGKKRIHVIYGPGSYFPILSVLLGTAQRATYTSLTETNLSFIPSIKFVEYIESSQPFCREILYKTINQLSMFADRVIDLQTTKLSDQLLLKLRILAKDHGVKLGDKATLPYRLTHQHLADMLGVERESISRNLSSLKTNGLIAENSYGYLVIVM